MKTYSLICIFLITLSSASAQDNMEDKKIGSSLIASQNREDVYLNINDSETVLTIKEDMTTEASLVRIESDIKLYLNIIRNVENIDLLFPKMNKLVKA